MSKKLFISHGDKGGTGKSMGSGLAINRMRRIGLDVLLIEGDAGIPDIAARFDGIITVRTVNMNRAGDSETSFNRLGGLLEEAASAGQDVVLNMPAGAGETIDELAPVLAEIVQGVGFDLVVSFSIAPTRTSTAKLLKSLDSGLLSVVSPDRRSVLFPAFLGAPSSFDWVKNPARVGFLDAGGREAAIPCLKPDDLRDKVLALPGAFSDLAEDKDAMTLTERALFKRWLGLADEAIGSIL